MAESIVSRAPDSTKVHKIKAFLVRPPRNSVCLRLVTMDDEEPTVVGAWEESETWKPDLAPEVVIACENHASEESAGVVRLKLQFVDIDKRELKALRLVHVREGAPSSVYQAQPGDLTGSQNSFMVQMQKHTETMMRLFAESQYKVLQQASAVTQHACDVANMMAQRLAESEQRSSDAEARARELRELADKLSSETATAEEKEQGAAELMKMLQPVLPYVLQLVQPKPPIPPTS